MIGTCPTCGASLREGGRFCPGCGLETHPLCPCCLAHPRPLAILDRGEAWCAGCGSLLFACSRCGRWLAPGPDRCPDPACAALVAPALPQHTGRRWDARGSTVGWRFPAAWDPSNPAARRPVERELPSADRLHAAWAAHGRLYRWEGSAVSCATLEGDVSWRSPLGPGGAPASGIAFPDRVAVVGALAVLALEQRFVVMDLSMRGEITALPGGSPLAHVAGPGGWLGWSRQGGKPTLYAAGVPPSFELLDPKPVEAPPESAPPPRSRMAMWNDRVFWPGGDGMVWEWSRSAGTVRRVSPDSRADPRGRVLVWADRGGARWARESAGEITLSISAPEGELPTLNLAVGRGPLAAIGVVDELCAVVGGEIHLFNSRTGERLETAARPAGRWIDSLLAPGAAAEPRYLALSGEGELASLYALRLASGAVDVLWRRSGVEPLGLLTVGHRLWIAHSAGLTALGE